MHTAQEHEAALRYFQRATQLDPGFAYAYTLSGHEYFACEDFEQARRLYETALSVDRRHYNAWYGIGQIDFRQEKYELAATHFQRAMEVRIRHTPLMYCSDFLSSAPSMQVAVSVMHFEHSTVLSSGIRVVKIRELESPGLRRCATGERPEQRAAVLAGNDAGQDEQHCKRHLLPAAGHRGRPGQSTRTLRAGRRPAAGAALPGRAGGAHAAAGALQSPRKTIH